MTFGWIFRVAVFAKRLVFMTHYAELGIIPGHLAVRGFPYLGRVMGNSHGSMTGRSRGFAHLCMAYGTLIEFWIGFAVAVHAKCHAFIGVLDRFR